MHLAENFYFSMAKENDNLLVMGEVASSVRKEIFLVKLILIRQLLNMKMRESDHTTSHINTFSRVMSELSYQTKGDRQGLKQRTSRSGKFCTHCKKSGLNISHSWSIKRKESGRRSERNQAGPDLNHSLVGNKINVVDTRLGEILSLEDSMIGDVLYIA